MTSPLWSTPTEVDGAPVLLRIIAMVGFRAFNLKSLDISDREMQLKEDVDFYTFLEYGEWYPSP